MKVNSIGIVPQTINCSNVIRTSCRVSRTASTLNASSPLRSSNQLRSMNESTSTDNHKDNKQDEEKENEKEGDEEDGVRIDREKVEEELKKRDQEVRLRKRIEAPIKLTKPIPFKSHFSQNLTNRKLNNNSSSINSNISKSDRKVRSRISQGLVGKAGLVGRNDKASKKKRRSSGLNIGNRLNSHRVLSEQRVVLAKNAGAIGGAEKRKSVVRWR
ncbi:hypothetical protein BY996DRAFT_6742898 [Phakopsora pachyrhizi]|nr:hypothetical protein BY996DRAFT_6742898 [Phakopsora pachyrhizi]